MTLITDIRSRLDADHPEIFHYVGGEHRLVEGSEREALLDEWARNVVADALSRLRSERDALLCASDWTGLVDAPLTDAQRAAWAKYRQALRDLPAKTKDAEKVRWPKAPGAKAEPDAEAED